MYLIFFSKKKQINWSTEDINILGKYALDKLREGRIWTQPEEFWNQWKEYSNNLKPLVEAQEQWWKLQQNNWPKSPLFNTIRKTIRVNLIFFFFVQNL